MKLAGLVAVALLAVAAMMVPGGRQPQPDPPLGTEEPAVAVCAVQEGAGRSTRLMVLSTVDGPVRLGTFASGETAAEADFQTGSAGLASVDMVDVAAVGTVGALVELPLQESAVGSLVIGPESMAAESCAPSPLQELFITGGSTVSGEEFELHLMNPYSGEAIVDLVVRSEVGLETAASLSSLVVPPSSSTIVDFTRVLPGREELSITIATQTGAVFGVGRQRANGESALWNAVAGGQPWYLPVPAGVGRTLLIGTPAGVDVDFQVDYYGPEGVEEVLETGTIQARGRVAIDLDTISQEAGAIRVSATGPVVPSLWISTDPGLASTTGTEQIATMWLIPAAALQPDEVGEEEEAEADEEEAEEAEEEEAVAVRARLVVLNPGLDDTVVSYRALGGDGAGEMDLAAEGVTEIVVDAADGYLVESTTPVVVLWVVERGGTGAVSIGVPLGDG